MRVSQDVLLLGPVVSLPCFVDIGATDVQSIYTVRVIIETNRYKL